MYKADPKETARYLGYRGSQPDQAVEALIEQCIAEAEATAVRKETHARFPLIVSGDDELRIASLRLHSKSLQRNLAGCSEVFLFAATIGIAVDMLIRRSALLDASKGLVMQAAGAAVIEAWCDEVNDRLKQEVREEGLFLRPRYSPGYGDLSLDCQRDFLYLLQAQKNIGLTVTDSGLMIPVKSVTAIIGISPVETSCHHQGCEECNLTDCAFRR